MRWPIVNIAGDNVVLSNSIQFISRKYMYKFKKIQNRVTTTVYISSRYP